MQTDVREALVDEREKFEAWADAQGFCITRDDSEKYREYHRATTRWAWQAWQARAALAASPQVEPGWQQLYRRAINEANGLTNYVEDRPELRSAERRIAKIEEEARALAAAPKRTEG